MNTCKIEGCDKPIRIKVHSLCRMHYERLRKEGKLTHPYPSHCSESSCNNKNFAKGLCRNHYYKRLYVKRVPIRYTHCTIDGCDQKHSALGLCEKHYHKNRYILRKKRNITLYLKKYDPTCTEDGCDRRHRSKGLCEMHYHKQRYLKKKSLK